MASAGYGAPSADPAAMLFEDRSHASTHESAHFDTIASEVIDASLPGVNASLWPTIYDGFFLSPQDHFSHNAHDQFNDRVELSDQWPGADLNLVQSSESTTSSITVTTEKTRVKRKRRITNGYGCEFCDETYHTAGDLAKHKLRKHTPSTQWPFICTLCDKRFYDKRDYGRHVDVENRRAAVIQAGIQMPAVANSMTTFALEPQSVLTETVSEASNMASDPQVNHQSPVLGGYHARYNHESPITARAGAHADLERLSTLPVVEITVSAKVVMGREIVAFSASHEIGSTAFNPMLRTAVKDNTDIVKLLLDRHADDAAVEERKITTPVADEASNNGRLVNSSSQPFEQMPQPQQRMHWAIGVMGIETEVETAETITATADPIPRVATSISRSRSVVVKPLTLEIRTRPSIRRSFTCPSNVTKLCSDFTTSCGLGEQSIMNSACAVVC